ncbi:MAG: hypothetical protein PHI12_06735 [Dehalococcoidales bacterium]|nr:hypothetical protein [Dehalococcoidales bacterium]
MEKFYSDVFDDIYCGNSLEVLRSLPDESVQMCVCSPPYWGLRNYSGGSDIVWGGDPNCQHEWGDIIPGPGQPNWDTFTKQYHNPDSHPTTIGKPMKRINKGNCGDKSTLVGTQTGQLSKDAND